LICPARSAWDLHRAWPKAELVMVPDAGHSATEAGITSALLAATDNFLQATPWPPTS
jgi:proline iminopeptidase